MSKNKFIIGCKISEIKKKTGLSLLQVLSIILNNEFKVWFYIGRYNTATGPVEIFDYIEIPATTIRLIHSRSPVTFPLIGSFRAFGGKVYSFSRGATRIDIKPSDLILIESQSEISLFTIGNEGEAKSFGTCLEPTGKNKIIVNRAIFLLVNNQNSHQIWTPRGPNISGVAKKLYQMGQNGEFKDYKPRATTIRNILNKFKKYIDQNTELSKPGSG